MKIFYIKIDEEIAGKYNRIEFKKLQSKIGRYIVEYAGKNIYNITDTGIVKVNNKPKFKYSDIKFSISHSKNIVLAAFDENSLGVDIEFMKDRDFKSLSGHYGITATDKDEFYRQWTQLEAEIKLQSEKGFVYTDKFEKDYMLTVISSNSKEFTPEITELNYPSY
ncbi:hypothetical protein IKP85_01110 [bacterium]|nr:hypothetical protein [bacterium]